MFNVESTLCG